MQDLGLMHSALVLGGATEFSMKQHRIRPLTFYELMMSSTDKIRCPHCLEELDYLEDPKQLPCTHVFCMPCLENITAIKENGVEVTCSICR